MALPPDEGTLLVLSTMGVPFYSARGLTQKLTPIDQAKQYRRDVNGTLVDISVGKFRKYSSSISCRDQNAPAIDGIYIGQIISVSCVAELGHPTGEIPARPAVGGSIRTEGGFTYYRPQLNMMIVGYETSTDEYQADIDWQLDLEEV